MFGSIPLEKSQKVISDDIEHVHNRYLLLYKLLKSSNKKMAQIFDGHSRSKAWLQLLHMRGEGLVDEALLSKLSDEFRDETSPEKYN